MKPLNVLSLFDGMSCGQLALKKAGIPVARYYASEIDKYAIAVTQANFPRTIQLGDVTKIDVDALPRIDLILAGSPCQGFSFAGKQLNFNDPRSALYFTFKNIKETLNPEYFLLENVRMAEKCSTLISQHMNAKYMEIDSSLLSIQSRKRLYWTNIKNITTIKNKGLSISDFDGPLQDKNRILKRPFTHKTGSGVLDLRGFYGGNSTSQRVYGVNGKLPTLLTNNTGGNNPVWITLDDIEAYRAHVSLCEYAQTLPIDYTKACPSLNQRYRMIGNGWTVDVVAHLLRGIK